MANEDRATRYHRLQRRASVAATIAAAVLLIVLLMSGGAVWLRQIVETRTGDSFVLSVAAYVVAMALLNECVQLPFSYYQGVTLEKRYGLSTERRLRWWLDRAKALAIGIPFAVVAALIVWSLLLSTPMLWWFFAAVAFSGILVALAQLAPVLLMPIFYNFRPLQRPALVERLIALATRADAKVLGVFEWQLSDRTRKANAALAGIGRTRRILLSDTLLADHSDEEIEVILAHELAHHVHRDIWSGIALESVLITCGFYAADRVLTAVGPWLGLLDKADIAGLPLLVLTAGGVSLVLLPVANALSRLHERRADRYALEMTRNADAFVSAMKRLSVQNLAEERPPRLIEVLFHSHPSTSARIAAARSWAMGENK